MKVLILTVLTCINCLEQYPGSAIKIESRFKIDKSDIKTKKNCCGTARHLNIKCCNYIYVPSSLRKYIVFKMSVILKIFYGIEKIWAAPIIYKCKRCEYYF